MNELLISRRDLLKYSAAGLAATSLPLSLLAQASVLRKAIPSTGEELPVIGVGTNSFNLAAQDQLAEVIQAMIASGGRVVDTAAAYGESEQTLGNIISQAGARDQLFIASKFDAGGGMGGPPPGAAGGMGGPPPGGGAMGGPPPGAGGNAPPPPRDMVHGEESFERSLERLQTDHLDLLQVHGMNGTEELMPKLVDYKKAGRIRYIGITTSWTRDHAKMVDQMKAYPLDFIQVNYSLGDRSAEEAVLPLALERGIAVLNNVPFGGRGARTLSAALDKPMPEWAADIGATSWAQILLKFVVSHPAVTVAIPGSTKVKHMLDNQLAASGPMPDAKMRERMARDWDALVGA